MQGPQHGQSSNQREGCEHGECLPNTRTRVRAKMSPHFASLRTTETLRLAVYMTAVLEDDVPGMREVVVGQCESMVMEVPIVRLDTDVDVDIKDSGVSGVLGVCGDSRGLGRVGGCASAHRNGRWYWLRRQGRRGCCEHAVKEGMGAVAPTCAVYGVVEGMVEGGGREDVCQI